MITFKWSNETGALPREIKDDKAQEKACIGVRCGLSWPGNLNQGGYFCLLAQETKRFITGEYPLLIIREFKALTMQALFEKMFDEMGMFGCFEIFTDLSSHFQTYIHALDLYKRAKRDLQDAKIKPAPYAESFLHGNDMIMKWLKVIKGLTIPRDFIIRSQLREIRETDLYGKPEEKFFAMNALRYALGAFETSVIPESTKDRVKEKPLPPGAWT